MEEIFGDCSIFEKDNWSFSNILRLGKPISQKTFSRFSGVSYRVPKLMTIDKEKDLFESLNLNFQFLKKEDIEEILKEDQKTIFIGAPDFETRKILNELGAQFIMVGHSNNTISIRKAPTIHDSITETYGSIDTPVLLLNLWAATYELVNLLSKPSQIYKADKNETLFEFNFDDLNNEEVNKLKKNFK
jgi:hypothetical protein